jgi:hypothetical protein
MIIPFRIVKRLPRSSGALSLLPLLMAVVPVRFGSAHPAQSPSQGLPAQRVASPLVASPGSSGAQGRGVPSQGSAPPRGTSSSQGPGDRLRTVAAKAGRANLGDLRDPFRIPPPPPPPPPGAAKAAARYEGGPRPPGIRGLYIEDLRLQGIVRQENTGEMIAMVTSDTRLAYFLRENEQLYDGVVTRITPGALYLRERVPGREVKWRDVVLKLDAGSAELR